MTRADRILLWIGVGLMVGAVVAFVIGLVAIYLRYGMGLW